MSRTLRGQKVAGVKGQCDFPLKIFKQKKNHVVWPYELSLVGAFSLLLWKNSKVIKLPGQIRKYFIKNQGKDYLTCIDSEKNTEQIHVTFDPKGQTLWVTSGHS